MEKKKVGSAYKDVAAKYKGDKSTEAKLIAKLKTGKSHMPIAASGAEIGSAIGHEWSAK